MQLMQMQKMQAYYLSAVFLVIAIVCISADKEVLDSNTQDVTDELTRKLWFQIKKRLSDYGVKEDDLEDLLDEEIETCDTKIENGTIIRTQESKKNGAVFLVSPTVNTRSGCEEECCEREKCNLGVFKEEGPDHSCYLFDCGTPSVCVFIDHPGFSSIHYPNRKTSNKVLDKHADDLANLAVEPPTTASTTTSSTTTQTPTPQPQDIPVPLSGPCVRHQDCEGMRTECITGYCMCQDGYHPQEGSCRKDCNKFEFECANVGHPMDYPQCIAIYNRCDGIHLCKDHSDELGCDDPKPSESSTDSKEDKSPPADSQDSHQAPDQNDRNKPMIKPDVSAETKTSDIDAIKPKVSDSDSQDEQDSETQEQPSQDVDLAKQKTSDETHESQDTSSDDDDKSKTSSESTKEDIKEDSSEDEKTDEQNEQNESEDSDSNSKELSADSNEQLPAKISILKLEQQDTPEIKKEGQGAFSKTMAFYQSNKGAVVALSLGLAITVILLFFVGCRLRNVRKKMRRGRPLSSNEADYLINGMYL